MGANGRSLGVSWPGSVAAGTPTPEGSFIPSGLGIGFSTTSVGPFDDGVTGPTVSETSEFVFASEQAMPVSRYASSGSETNAPHEIDRFEFAIERYITLPFARTEARTLIDEHQAHASAMKLFFA